MDMLKTLGVLSAALLFVVWFISSTYIQYIECKSSKGILVRGIVGMECVTSTKNDIQ